MSAWLKRFGLHLAAAVGATGVFVAAAAVGASQTRQQAAIVSPDTTIVARPSRTPRRPTVEVTPTAVPPVADAQSSGAGPTATPASGASPANPPDATEPTAPPASGAPAANPPAASKPSSGQPRPTATPGAAAVRPERSLAGTVQSVGPDTLVVLGVGGRTWRVEPAPGALIRVNGKAAKLDAIQPGDGVVILGQAQAGPGLRFLAHAITAKSH